MKSLLVKLALWALRKWAVHKLSDFDFDSPLAQLASQLMADQEGRLESGEWKRHQVLARLMKAGASESEAAWTIENLIQARKRAD